MRSSTRQVITSWPPQYWPEIQQNIDFSCLLLKSRSKSCFLGQYAPQIITPTFFVVLSQPEEDPFTIWRFLVDFSIFSLFGDYICVFSFSTLYFVLPRLLADLISSLNTLLQSQIIDCSTNGPKMAIGFTLTRPLKVDIKSR